MRRLLLSLLLLTSVATAHADEDPGAALLESGAVFVEAELDPAKGAVVGQRVSLLLTLGTTNWFTGAPALPEPEIEGAIVRRFGSQAVNASENREGTTYAVQTWTWWVYPRRAGTFEIPSLEVVLNTVDDDREKVEVRARTKPLAFEAVAPPDAGPGDVLVTKKFVVEQTLEPEPKDLKVGDALRRTLTLRADDVPGMLIPPVSSSAPDGLRPYPDAPRVEDEYDRGTLRGLRVESTSWILEREGEFVLPEIRRRWWNLETKAWEEAVAEAIPFTVAPNPDAVLGTPAASEEEDIGRAEPLLSPGGWAALLLALALTAVGTMWFVRRLPGWKLSLAEARERRRTSEPAAFHRFEAACRMDDPRQARNALRAWLDRAASPSLTLEQFAAGDEALARALDDLGTTLYGESATSRWSGAEVARQVTEARRRMLSDPRPEPTARRPLNPRANLTHR